MLNPKIKGLLAFSVFLSVFLINTQYTDADIFAERNVKNNSFSAAKLNFSAKNTINGGTVTILFKTLGIQPEGYDFGAVKIKNEEGQNLHYLLKAEKTNGDDDFCNALNIQVLRRNWSQRYYGSLMNLVVDSALSNETPEDWIFFVSLDNNNSNLKNKICEFNLSFKTYRNNPDEQGGIFAKRVLNNSVSSSNW